MLAPHRLTAVSSVTCDGNATCSGASCTCNTNYYGTGFSCARKSTLLINS